MKESEELTGISLEAWEKLRRDLMKDGSMKDNRVLCIAPSEWNPSVDAISGIASGIEPIANVMIGIHREPLSDEEMQLMVLKNRSLPENFRPLPDFMFEDGSRRDLKTSKNIKDE